MASLVPARPEVAQNLPSHVLVSTVEQDFQIDLCVVMLWFTSQTKGFSDITEVVIAEVSCRVRAVQAGDENPGGGLLIVAVIHGRLPGATVAEWLHSRLPPLRPGFGSRLYLKWES